MFKKLLDVFDDLLERTSNTGKYDPYLREYKQAIQAYKASGSKKPFDEFFQDRRRNEFQRKWAQYKKENNICEHVESGKRSKWGFEICSICGNEFDPNPDNVDKYDTLMG